MTLKGRHWVMFWFIVVLGVAGGINLRQTIAYATVRQLREAREERAALEARRGELERRIFQASGRQVLVPRAASALGLHEPAADEITVFVMPTDAPGGLPADVANGTDVRTDSVRKAPPARPRAVQRAPAKKPAAKPAVRRPASRSTTRRH
jgi:hypothetical protein